MRIDLRLCEGVEEIMYQIIGVMKELKNKETEEKSFILYSVDINKIIIKFEGRWDEKKEKILFEGKILKIPGYYENDVNQYLLVYEEHVNIFFEGIKEINYEKVNEKGEHIIMKGYIII